MFFETLQTKISSSAFLVVKELIMRTHFRNLLHSKFIRSGFQLCRTARALSSLRACWSEYVLFAYAWKTFSYDVLFVSDWFILLGNGDLIELILNIAIKS